MARLFNRFITLENGGSVDIREAQEPSQIVLELDNPTVFFTPADAMRIAMAFYEAARSARENARHDTIPAPQMNVRDLGALEHMFDDERSER